MILRLLLARGFARFITLEFLSLVLLSPRSPHRPIHNILSKLRPFNNCQEPPMLDRRDLTRLPTLKGPIQHHTNLVQ